MKTGLRTTPRDVAEALERERRELERFLLRMVLRPAAVTEILEATAERALSQATHAPRRDAELRLWLWRIAVGLAEAEWTARPEWREGDMAQALRRARTDPALVRDGEALRGTPETASMARDNMAFCLELTIAQLPPRHAAALHLFNLTGFSSADIAEILAGRVTQVEGWSAEARGAVDDQLGRLCGLARLKGSCRQCLDLDQGFAARRGDPLANTDGALDARLEVVRRSRESELGAWHRRLVQGLDELGARDSR